MMIHRRTIESLPLAFLLVVCLSSGAHAVNPYDNWALPDGWYLSAYPTSYTASEYRNDSGRTTTNTLGSRAELASVRATYYSRTMIAQPIAFTAFLPIGRKELLGRTDSGIGDLTVGAGWWIRDDIASTGSVVVGAYIDAPTGSYDKPNDAVSIGRNVWKIRPAVGWAKLTGPIDVEASLFYNWYDVNRDTGVRQGAEVIAEGYAGYFVRPGTMIGIAVNGLRGDDRTYHGQRQPNTGATRYQAGSSVYVRASERTNITITYLNEFGVRNAPEGHLLTCRLTARLF